jgi:hypothetical protein
MLPKLKSWRDTGDTPYRKNHWEEAKLWLLHTPSPRIAFPLHVKQRNQEGSRTTRRQGPDCLKRHRPQGKLSSTQYSHRQSWARSAQPPGQTNPHPGIKEKLNNKQQQKRHVAKRVGCPECQRGRGAILHGTVNKQAGQRRQERRHPPSNQERESLQNRWWEENPTEEARRPTSHVSCK